MSARIDELSKPRSDRVREKYTGPYKKVYPPIERPIVPLPNERLHILAEPNQYHPITPKYEIPANRPTTNIKKTTLEAVCSERVEMLARPFVGKLQSTKQLYKFLGSKYAEKINDQITKSLDTMYYSSVKNKIQADQDKKSKSPKKKIWSADKNRLGILAAPKKVPQPTPPEVGNLSNSDKSSKGTNTGNRPKVFVLCC